MKSIKSFFFTAILIAICTSSASAQDDLRQMAREVEEILITSCGDCHEDSDDGRIDYIGNLAMLVERKKIVPGQPEASRILIRMLSKNKPMPPQGDGTPPSKKQIELVQTFVEKLEGKSVDQIRELRADQKKAAPREPVSNADIIQTIHKHLSRLDEDDRKFQRYFVLNNLHNLPPESENDRSGISNEFLDLVRAATSKTLNSLSWSPSIVLPRILDKQKTVMVIDLRDVGWDRNTNLKRPDLWEVLVQEYPYALKHDQYPDSAGPRRMAREIYEGTGIEIPWIRADWFVANATQPQNYHALMFDTIFKTVRARQPREVEHADGKKRVEQPMNEADLYHFLNVDVKGNLRRGRAARAAFTRSGVSSQPRMIERHSALFGYVWNSYDFKKGNLTSNLFARPLGPPGTFNVDKFGRYSFQHDGGEMIFGLPNGLHGYFLVDGKGDRIAFGPPDVVEDRAKTLGNGIIVNGLSCIACHQNGLITDFEDEVRYGLKGLQADARKIARRLYLDRPELDVKINKDQERYRSAAIETIGPYLGQDLVKKMKKGGFLVEPVGPVAKRFLTKTIGTVQIAADLGISEADLVAAIKFNENLKELGLASLTKESGTNREILESGVGTSFFQKVAIVLKLGSPTSIQPRPWRGR